MKSVMIIAALVVICCSMTSVKAQQNDVDRVYKAMVRSFEYRNLHERWVPHTDLVLKRTRRLLEVVDADRRVTEIGAILHDIGKGTDDHEAFGAVIAAELITGLDLEVELAKTMHTFVDNHHKAECELTDEFFIMWLADRLRVELPDDNAQLLKVYNDAKEELKKKRSGN